MAQEIIKPKFTKRSKAQMEEMSSAVQALYEQGMSAAMISQHLNITAASARHSVERLKRDGLIKGRNKVKSRDPKPPKPPKPKRSDYGTSSNYYWNDDVRLAVDEFVELGKLERTVAIIAKRNQIWTKRIHKAVYAMCQIKAKMLSKNSVSDEFINDLVAKCYSNVIDKFDPGRGTNSFSYFSRCVTNDIYMEHRKKLDHWKRGMPVDFAEPFKEVTDKIKDLSAIEQQEHEDLAAEMRLQDVKEFINHVITVQKPIGTEKYPPKKLQKFKDYVAQINIAQLLDTSEQHEKHFIGAIQDHLFEQVNFASENRSWKFQFIKDFKACFNEWQKELEEVA